MHYFRNLIWFLWLTWLVCGCDSQVSKPQQQQENWQIPPKVTPQDTKYAKVFQVLNGHWQGKFCIYTDTRGQQPKPENIHLDHTVWQSSPYKLQQTIEVEQIYQSSSPYFQTVVIRDTYQDNAGNKTTVESRGVNKVEEGKLWCVVKKPDETVVHEGTSQGNIIIWQRNIKEPSLKVEYFREEVENNTYTIHGWGYYAEDDVNLAPQIFFYGKYTRKQ